LKVSVLVYHQYQQQQQFQAERQIFSTFFRRCIQQIYKSSFRLCSSLNITAIGAGTLGLIRSIHMCLATCKYCPVSAKPSDEFM
jgi:hypothetical protein